MTEPLPVVLVVDDTPETRRLMRRVLERDRIRVVEAATGEEALERIVSLRPAAVVLDLRLPGMSGFDVARRVRAHPEATVRATVLLACSASVQAEVIHAALAAGCDDFEGKPFDVTTFAARVRAAMAMGGSDRPRAALEVEDVAGHRHLPGEG
jgi:CheY-like chemotaxis protein